MHRSIICTLSGITSHSSVRSSVVLTWLSRGNRTIQGIFDFWLSSANLCNWDLIVLARDYPSPRERLNSDCRDKRIEESSSHIPIVYRPESH
jgi:hypothetical protein